MAKNGFTWNPSGYDALKKSADIKGECKKYADNVANAARGMHEGLDIVVEERTYAHWDGYVVRTNDGKSAGINRALNVLETALRSV